MKQCLKTRIDSRKISLKKFDQDLERLKDEANKYQDGDVNKIYFLNLIVRASREVNKIKAEITHLESELLNIADNLKIRNTANFVSGIELRDNSYERCY